MSNINKEIDADKIEGVKFINTGKQVKVNLNDEKTKTKIKLAEGLRNKFIVPGKKK